MIILNENIIKYYIIDILIIINYNSTMYDILTVKKIMNRKKNFKKIKVKIIWKFFRFSDKY